MKNGNMHLVFLKSDQSKHISIRSIRNTEVYQMKTHDMQRYFQTHNSEVGFICTHVTSLAV
jgi:hypothetical protein